MNRDKPSAPVGNCDRLANYTNSISKQRKKLNFFSKPWVDEVDDELDKLKKEYWVSFRNWKYKKYKELFTSSFVVVVCEKQKYVKKYNNDK